MKAYKVLQKQSFVDGSYSIVPLRFEDRMNIMQWRNEQIYHLRQTKPLTIQDQDNYFNNVVNKLFDAENPNQILFSFLENNICVGYGGLVHINWVDKNAEISFIMQTALEKTRFEEIWIKYLSLLEDVAFGDLKLFKIFTYAFDVRPHLYSMLSKANYNEVIRLKDHCFFDGGYLDVLIHSKFNNLIEFRLATIDDLMITFDWATNKNIRKYAIQKEEISFDNHKKWFFNKLESLDCLYFIVEVSRISIGSIRFDINHEKEALISFLLDPKFHGKGYGKSILEIGCSELLKLKEIKKIIGVVSIENIPSLKSFKALEFNQKCQDENYVTFEKQIQKI